MTATVTHVTASDGTDLLTRHWPVAQGRGVWASVLLVHGLGEHSGRYEHVGAQLAAAGLEAFAYDQVGNGGSGGRRGHVDRWSRLHDHLAERLAAVRAASPGRPMVLYGHSAGGMIAAGYCLTERPKPDLVVLGSPALDSTLPAWKQALAPILSRIVPTLPIPNGIEGSMLSRDPSVGERAGADPSCARTSTARFGKEGLAEQARVVRLAAGGLGVPTLVIHGQDDSLVPVAASGSFEGAPLTTRRVYPGLRHELHNEPEGAQVVSDVIDWLRVQVSPPARGA